MVKFIDVLQWILIYPNQYLKSGQQTIPRAWCNIAYYFMLLLTLARACRWTSTLGSKLSLNLYPED